MFVYWLSFLSLSMAECPHYQETRSVFWGDLHVHTAHSLDAALQGTLTSHQQAYDFAKGQPVRLGGQKENQLERALDFVAITDHAEFFGETQICTDNNREGYSSVTCRLYRNHPSLAFLFLNAKLSQQPKGNPAQVRRLRLCNKRGVDCGGVAEEVWLEQNRLAASNNQHCTFTTFPAYEWSASPRTQNLHRNIIFQSDQVPSRAISYFDSPTPIQLWSALDQACVDGCSYISIPHNSNLCSGKMFLPYREEDKEALVIQAQHHADHEFLVEIFQHKGSSECYPTLTDEHCSFEYLPFNNLIADRYDGFLTKQPTEQDFVRTALKEGLLYQENGIVNPYQLGFVAATDTHLGAPGLVEEETFTGHGGAGSSSEDPGEGLPDSPYFNGGGLTAVWAEENTRASLFASFQRREVYGTSGPRISLRFFATSRKIEGDCGTTEWLREAYQSGTPMGGEIENSGDIHFYILTEKDALSSGLETAQIIKGWIDEGETKEKIYSLALLDNQARHCLHWQDPDATQGRAFYYVRVLEKERPRWSKEACAKNRCPEMISDMIQERAWSSPIWLHDIGYTKQKGASNDK